ncbi:hypothetical protein GCM10007377_12160 [Galliscardovia ingluviei]|uniref:Uncharacterized protein n=1 Tax=Galliscardovia ingluviei TaxID=1769422 RepID=A0A8J3EZQ6_9BIFI|nr:hypothetical protein [Galliscardovia ingluviei]GGI14686.1 hypothetical protein GCM10007377_12160 [Galliscardovia ingluviei]
MSFLINLAVWLCAIATAISLGRALVYQDITWLWFAGLFTGFAVLAMLLPHLIDWLPRIPDGMWLFLGCFVLSAVVTWTNRYR